MTSSDANVLPKPNGASQQNFTWSPNGALVAHTLCYRSTAGILGSGMSTAVIIVRVHCSRPGLPRKPMPFMSGHRMALIALLLALHLPACPR